MAANRRHKERSRKGFYLNSMLLFVSLTLVVFLYVWQQIQFVRVGYSLKRLEGRLEKERKDNRALRLRVSALKSPAKIEGMISQRGLVLHPPKEAQIVRLGEGSGPGPAPRRRRLGSVPASVAASRARRRPASVL